jgi:uncharacterized membrane protein (UPF0127 family)
VPATSFALLTKRKCRSEGGQGYKACLGEVNVRFKTNRIGVFLLSLFLLFSWGKDEIIYPQQREEDLFQLTIKGKKIRVEVVRTESEKARGLMFRDKLETDEGMLFVYEEEEFLTFWMKNTPLPLSIAFIDKKGRIVDIQDMEPFSLRTHTSSRPARFALEMNRNWFQKNGIKVGDVVKMPSSLEK